MKNDAMEKLKLDVLRFEVSVRISGLSGGVEERQQAGVEADRAAILARFSRAVKNAYQKGARDAKKGSA